MSKLLFLLILFSVTLVTKASIIVSPMVIDLTHQKPNAEIAVKNGDLKNKAYVEIIPYRFINPAHDLTKRTRILNPKVDGLLVFPAKLLLLPGQTQFVRVIKTQENIAVDKVYEIEIMPKLVTHLVNKNNNVALGIKLIVGYGVRTTLRPDKPQPKLSIKRVKNQLFIKNSGNTNITINSCTQQRLGRIIQVALPFYTIFAGQNAVVNLFHTNPVTLTASYVGQSIGSFQTT